MYFLICYFTPIVNKYSIYIICFVYRLNFYSTRLESCAREYMGNFLQTISFTDILLCTNEIIHLNANDLYDVIIWHLTTRISKLQQINSSGQGDTQHNLKESWIYTRHKTLKKISCPVKTQNFNQNRYNKKHKFTAFKIEVHL